MVGMVPGRCSYVSHMFVGWRRSTGEATGDFKTEKRIRSCAVFVLASSLPQCSRTHSRRRDYANREKLLSLRPSIEFSEESTRPVLIGPHNSIVKDTMMCTKGVRRSGRFSSTSIDNFFADPATGRRRRDFPWPGLMRGQLLHDGIHRYSRDRTGALSGC